MNLIDLRQAIIAAFADGDLPPLASPEMRQLLSYWESRDFMQKLSGKRWQELLDPVAMRDISNDAAVWTGYMPPDWFPYYLPALLVAALSGRDAFASNLRGLLKILLVLDDDAPEWAITVHRTLRDSLSDAQWRAVESYIESPLQDREGDLN